MNQTQNVVTMVALAGLALAIGQPAGGARAKGFRFANGHASACIPFNTDSYQIHVRAQVNGGDSAWFALDSGAQGSVLDAGKAAALGITATGNIHSFGAGGPQEGAMVDSVDIALPGFELLDLNMDTLDLQPLSIQSGRPMEGILGHQVFEHCVVEVDYERGCVNIQDADGYRYQGTGTIVPLTFLENHPYVTARVTLPSGRALTGRFILDTGSSGALILAPEVVARENLLATVGKTLSTRAHGVGGGVDIKIGRVARLDIGRFTFARPVTTFQPAGVGRISEPGTLGNIGGGVLSRFKVIFDYSRRRMILEPRPTRIAAPFDTDMSGLALVSTPPDYRLVRVARVMDDSPAAGAGMRVGDEIERVDGMPAADVGLLKLRRMLRNENREVRFDLRRGAEPVMVTIRTRRMI